MIYKKIFDNSDLFIDGVKVHEAKGGGILYCKCDICGKDFHILVKPRGFGNRRRTDVCSDQCAYIRDLKKQREKREKARKRKCLNCSKVFTPARNDAKYCCGACKQEAYRKRVKGKVLSGKY
jgi:uncharacterized OB-fold protein